MKVKKKNITNLLLGYDTIFSLEDRGLNAVLFVTLLVSFVSFVTDVIINLGAFHILYDFLMALTFGIFYYLGRRKPNFKKLAIPVCIINITPPIFVWYFLGGMSGASMLFIVSYVIILPLILKNRSKYIVLIVLVLVTFSLLIFELNYPEFVHSYLDKDLQQIDMFLSSTYVSMGAFILMNLILFSYRQEQKRNELLNARLAMANEELNSKNEELNATLKYLHETQSKLVHVEKMASLGVLTAGVSHEINNPLNFIIGGHAGLADYLSRKGLAEDHEIQVLLNSILAGAERVTDIVNGLNQFSRDNKVHDEDCDIHSIITNCLSVLRNQVKQRIKIVKDFADIPIMVKGNKSDLHQVILNIISNGISAIEDQGKITIATYRLDKKCIIEISDTGIGIDEEILDKITDPFFTTKPPGKGTGLGLSISNNIVKEHNGILHFKSLKGRGTSVIITFPLLINLNA